MKRDKKYPTDINDSEWDEIKQELPKEKKTGRPREVCFRDILNGIFYVIKTGCQWRMLPLDYPKWETVYGYFRNFTRNGFIEKIHNKLRDRVRLEIDRNKKPSAGIIDSQSVKSIYSGEARGFDGGKLIKGIKRHILVDTQGLLLGIVITPANIQDRRGAEFLLNEKAKFFPDMRLVWADGGYTGEVLEETAKKHGIRMEIIKRSDDVKGFKLLPRRWVVERTFSWLNNYRRLSKDYEQLVSTSKSVIYLSMIRLMLKRLA